MTDKNANMIGLGELTYYTIKDRSPLGLQVRVIAMFFLWDRIAHPPSIFYRFSGPPENMEYSANGINVGSIEDNHDNQEVRAMETLAAAAQKYNGLAIIRAYKARLQSELESVRDYARSAKAERAIVRALTKWSTLRNPQSQRVVWGFIQSLDRPESYQSRRAHNYLEIEREYIEWGDKELPSVM